MGRPKVTIEVLPEGWQKTIIDLYKEGAADVEIKALIYEWRGSFSDDLWDRWLQEEPEFSGTIKRGRQLSEAWWVKEGRGALRDKSFSFVGWYMNMKNRFGWSDKVEQKNEGETVKVVVSQDHKDLLDAVTDELHEGL